MDRASARYGINDLQRGGRTSLPGNLPLPLAAGAQTGGAARGGVGHGCNTFLLWPGPAFAVARPVVNLSPM